MGGKDPTVLAIDIASGGVSACLIRQDLSPSKSAREEWQFVPDGAGGTTLSAALVWERVVEATLACVSEADPPDALVLSSMMHTLVVSDVDGVPRSPVFTWLDRRHKNFADDVPEKLGIDYPVRTGSYFHPSFSAFKLACMRQTAPEALIGTFRIASAKSYVQAKLTGNWTEDISTASASGLLNLHTGEWDPQTLEALEIDSTALPLLTPVTAVTGTLSIQAADTLGLPRGLPVVAGGGDGFLANLGSGCESPDRTALTLGTTGGVRRFVSSPKPDANRGSFCYRYGDDSFLVGCASNNGGNVLDWAREQLDTVEFDSDTPTEEPPLFFPFLHGERSPFWDPEKRAYWVGVREGHTTRDLFCSVVEGLAFQLGIYCEILSDVLESTSTMAVLSGNGFQVSRLGAVLAAVIPARVIEPDAPGLATLRGAARCGFEALGISTAEAMENLLDTAKTIAPSGDDGLQDRFERFKTLYFDN